MSEVLFMKIGFIGLGKLGLPCALAIERFGQHEVCGYDLNPDIRRFLSDRAVPYQEQGVRELLETTSLRLLGSVDEVVSHSDIVFLAVQTPHHPDFEGTKPLTDDRRDFDYSYLIQASREVAEAAKTQGRSVVLAVISTVLPGTMRDSIVPLLNPWVSLVYNPFFIAMGTAIPDFMNPEFVLLGSVDEKAEADVRAFYGTLHQAPVIATGIETAELIKMAYNTFIGMKIVFANALMEICHKSGSDVDEVTTALSMATDRLISNKYMSAGMGDGGGCHPRDQIAMSFLARKLDLSYDLFDGVMQARDRQTEWLAELVRDWQTSTGLPVCVLGKAYKPGTNLCIGSPSALLDHFLLQKGVPNRRFDPHVDGDLWPVVEEPFLFVIATKHQEFAGYSYPPGSVVIDPWGYIPDQDGLQVVRIGRQLESRK